MSVSNYTGKDLSVPVNTCTCVCVYTYVGLMYEYYLV